MLSSDAEFNWGLSPFSCSAPLPPRVNTNTNSLPEGSYGESLVRVSLPRTLLAVRHVASVLLGSPRSVSSSWYKQTKKTQQNLRQLLKKPSTLNVWSHAAKKLFKTDEFLLVMPVFTNYKSRRVYFFLNWYRCRV